MIVQGYAEIDASKATELLNGPIVITRTSEPIRVDSYSKQMMRDMWEEGGTIILYENENGEYSILNGFHRLQAVVRSGTKQIFNIVLVQGEDALEQYKRNQKKKSRQTYKRKIRKAYR